MPINFNSPGEVTGGAESQGMYSNDIKVSQLAGQQIQDVKTQVRTQQLREALSPILSDPNLSTEAKMRLSQQTIGKFDSLKAYDGMLDQYKLQQQQKQSAESGMFNFFANQMNNVTTPEQGELLVKMAQEGLKGTAYEPMLQNASIIVKPDKTVVLEKPFIGQDGKSVTVKHYNRAGQVVDEKIGEGFYTQVANPKMGVIDFVPTPKGKAIGLKPYKESITASPAGSGSDRETEGDKRRSEFGQSLKTDPKTGRYSTVNPLQGQAFKDNRVNYTNAVISKMREVSNKYSTIESLLNSDSMIAPNSVQFAVARMLNGPGVLTQADFDNAKLDPTVLNDVNKVFARKLVGKLTPSEKKSVRLYVKTMAPIAIRAFNEVVDNAATGFAQQVGVPESEAKAFYQQQYGIADGEAQGNPTGTRTFNTGAKTFSLPNK